MWSLFGRYQRKVDRTKIAIDRIANILSKNPDMGASLLEMLDTTKLTDQQRKWYLEIYACCHLIHKVSMVKGQYEVNTITNLTTEAMQQKWEMPIVTRSDIKKLIEESYTDWLPFLMLADFDSTSSD